MEPEQEQEAKRRICESVRTEWTPKLQALISARCAETRISWAEACDELEMNVVVHSETLKELARQSANPDTHEIGPELTAQGVLQAIANLRKLG